MLKIQHKNFNKDRFLYKYEVLYCENFDFTVETDFTVR